MQFGHAIAAGDFNDDSIRELAIVAYAAGEVCVSFGRAWDVAACWRAVASWRWCLIYLSLC
jgi:hypothetical protein